MKKNLKKLFLFFICSLFPIGVIYSQKYNEVDSLLKKLKNVKHDTIRVNLLFKIGDIYIKSNPDSSLYYYNMALIAINKTNKYPNKNQDIALCFKNIGNSYVDLGKYDNAIEYLKKSLKIYDKIYDKKNIASCYMNIGTVYYNISLYTKAIEYYFKSLKISDEINDTYSIASCYLNIGNVHFYLNDNKNAEVYYHKSLKIFKEIGNKKGESRCYNNIGSTYLNHSNYNIAKALEYYLKSLKLKEELCDKKGIAGSYNNIGNIYSKDADSTYNIYKRTIKYNKAIEYYFKSLKIKTEIGDKIGIALLYSNLSNVYTKLGKYAQALEYAEKGLAISKEASALKIEKDIYENLYIAYDSLKDFKKSYEYQKLFIKINDSIFNEESSKQITDIQTKYETEKKEQDILVKEKELQIQKLKISRMNYYVFILAILVLLILSTAFFIIRRNKYRALLKNIQLEQKLLQSQMNPHFIFNSLSVIQSIIYKKESELAVKYLSKFAKLTRMILENSRVDYITLEKEITMLEIYLDLQSIRFENKFNYTIETDEQISPEFISIPPMLAQPFIENSIEHGIIHKKSTGNIKIVFRKAETDLLAFEVSDDGVGRKKSKELKELHSLEEKKHISLATTITMERLENINKSLKKKITLDIIDLEDAQGNASGTKVTFLIPFKTT